MSLPKLYLINVLSVIFAAIASLSVNGNTSIVSPSV